MNRLHISLRILSFLFLCATLPTWAQSQATTGVIRGSVRDQFGNPIGNATIALKETSTNYRRTLTSSNLGLFTATLLPLGFYDITVQADGTGRSAPNRGAGAGRRDSGTDLQNGTANG